MLLACTFFQSLVNDDVKVNKTQRIYTKIHSEVDSCLNFDAINFISQSETRF